jgi:alpha-N-arabinofuranosidase
MVWRGVAAAVLLAWLASGDLHRLVVVPARPDPLPPSAGVGTRRAGLLAAALLPSPERAGTSGRARAGAFAGVGGQPRPPEARIKVDLDRRIGEVDPRLFGSFAEHLGRMIYGGIYDEGSPLADADGFRTDVMGAVKGLGITVLRWPGGNFASGYNWKDGIGPKDRRPVRLDLAWNALESNRFGTDEFLRYAERLGVEPYICVNLGLGTIDDARHWVEYTNEARHTFWADERRRNGRDAPYKVRYWALGNEIDGPWQLGHKGADEYARFALEAAKAMRAVDPDIVLVASGSSHYGGDWIGWNRTVLSVLRHVVDFIAIHTYIANRENDLERYLGEWSRRIEQYIEVTAGLIREVQSGQANPRPIFIAYDEWNVWYRTGVREGLEERYSFEDALAIGMFMNAFFRHADVVKMANLAQLVNVLAPIVTNREGLFLQPIYFPFAEYGKQRGNVSLDVWVSAPTYTLGTRPPLSYLDVSATFHPVRRELFLNVLNRSRDRAITARVENQEGRLAREAVVWELDHPDVKATHTFGDDRRVRPVTRVVSLDLEGQTFLYTFPAHSLTILRLRVP